MCALPQAAPPLGGPLGLLEGHFGGARRGWGSRGVGGSKGEGGPLKEGMGGISMGKGFVGWEGVGG